MVTLTLPQTTDPPASPCHQMSQRLQVAIKLSFVQSYLEDLFLWKSYLEDLLQIKKERPCFYFPLQDKGISL